MPQHITVENYDPEWPLIYTRERDRIAEILKDNCIYIYHIGSVDTLGACVWGFVRDMCFGAMPPGFACGETSEPGFASPVGHSVSKKEQRRCSFRGGA